MIQPFHITVAKKAGSNLNYMTLNKYCI